MRVHRFLVGVVLGLGTMGCGADDACPMGPEDERGAGETSHSAWGEPVGDYLGVAAYSNGDSHDVYGSGDQYYLEFGYQYQCVEYVNRFLSEALSYENLRGSGNAKDYWNADRGLIQYDNDGSACPEASDVLVSTYGLYGHVAVVSEVNDDSVTVVQQNWANNAADGAYPLLMDRTDAGCQIHPFGDGNYAVAGWLRVP